MKNLIQKNIIYIIAAFISNFCQAQDFTFKDYNWKENDIKFDIPEEFKNENEIILERNIKVEFVVTNDIAKQYYLLHEKIYLNSDNAIERNNKMYIPFSIDESVLTNKARVILKNGKIIELNQKDIKEEIDEEKQIKYHFFAINGLEKGAVIEKIYILQEKPQLDGNTIKMQTEYPILKINFELIHPKYLVFKTKNYNGLNSPILDEKTYPDKVAVTIQDKNILGISNDEKYSNSNIHLKMFRYKLDQNLNSRARNLNNFKEFSTNLYDKLNKEYDKKEMRALEAFCNTIPKSDDPQEQIWNIENKIKKTIIYEKYIDNKASFSEIIKSKQANNTDLVKAYLAIFKFFKIQNNLVFTTNRYKLPFDPDFESFENLNETLFYFPEIKKFLTPTETEYRIPFFPTKLGNVNGLFIKEKKFAGVTMGIGEINFIEIPGTDLTHDTMEIIIDFTKEIDNPTVTNEIRFGGYSALNFQPIKDFVSPEEYKTIIKSVAENYTLKTEYKTLTTENDGTAYIGKKPFVLKVSFEGKDLIQKAGDNYLFSIGQIIGKQMELYQENKRKLPVEIDYPHSYSRKIKVILPKDFAVKNLEKFNMNHKTVLNGEIDALFTSSFTKNNNEIDIDNTEFYKAVNYPLDKFEDYRNVINAAADFNKIVIILSKI